MYKEIVVITKSVASDDVADVMWAIGANGVKVLDPKDLDFVLHSDTCWDYVEEHLLSQPDVVKVSYFVEDSELEENLTLLNEYLKPLISQYGLMEVEVLDVPDVNWEEDWKKFYKPLQAGKFLIIPEWLDDESDNVIIKINPSKAFGTGEHASTRLCLELMSTVNFVNKNVIDVGAGSGILGIGAAKCGAKHVDMCDIDKETLECANENAVLNGVDAVVGLTAGGITAISNYKADVLLCNLTADILNLIVADLSCYIKQDGIVICSGILDKKANELIENFKKHNLHLLSKLEEGEWVGVKFRYGN